MDKHALVFSSRNCRALLVVIVAMSLAVPMLLHAADKNPGGGNVMDSPVQDNLGKKFPVVNAETLEGSTATVPDDAAGKVTLVCVAFLQQSQSQLDSWLNPFYEKFGNREDTMFYEVPMISGGYRFMKMIIDGGMRGGLPAFKHKHVVTMYGDVESYKKALDVDPTRGHAFLLDRDGTIRWQDQGFSDAGKLESLFAATEALLKQ